MNSNRIDKLLKICHAKVGQKIRLPDPATGEIMDEVFVVVALEQPGRRPARQNMSHGLYDDQRQLMLVSLTTGFARALPHLSSRAQLLKADDLAAVVAAAEAPVLTAEPVKEFVQVEMLTDQGKTLIRDVDLADAMAVRDFLARLQTTNARLTSVKEVGDRSAETVLMTQWRHEVCKGLTLSSFEEYKKVNS